MIRYFQGRDRNRFPRQADEMFRLRARQFRDRLKWNVRVDDGWEIDEFDHMNPLYLVSLDDTNEMAGCLRFLPTTGPTMMKAVFDPYFDHPLDIESPLIWECTRLAIEPSVARRRTTPNGLCKTTFELLQGLCEVAMLAGVEQIVAIFDHPRLRIFQRAGWTPEIIASTDRLGPHIVYFGIWEANEASLRAMRERSGLNGSVLEDTTPLLTAAA